MASISLVGNTVAENVSAGTVIGTFSAVPDKSNETITYELTENPGDRFEIRKNAATGQYELVVKNGGSTLFDFENEAQRDFAVVVSAKSTDPSGTVTPIPTRSFIINVIDNVAPSEIKLSGTSVTEHAGAGTVIGSISAFDANLPNDTFTFSLLNDAEGRFEIKDGKLLVKDGSKLDYLTKASHEVTIQVTDSDGNHIEKTLTVGIKDAFEVHNGTSRTESVYGTNGADYMDAKSGNDEIYGGSGNDRIYGGDGADMIYGGSGKDILYGGAGKDSFVFNTPVQRGSYDEIRDFNPLEDTIQLSLSSLQTFKVKASFKDLVKSVFTGGNPYKKHYYSLDKVMSKGKLDSKFFSTSYKAKDSNDFVYYNKKNGFVYFDADGNGREQGIAIIKLQKGLTLTADDFLMI